MLYSIITIDITYHRYHSTYTHRLQNSRYNTPKHSILFYSNYNFFSIDALRCPALKVCRACAASLELPNLNYQGLHELTLN